MAASPGGVEVGRVSVRVVPDTSEFGASLKAKLDAIEKNVGDIHIKVDVDTTEITAPLERVRGEQETRPLTVPVKANTDAFAAGIRADALKISKTVQIDIPLTAEGERLRQDIATQVALIEALTRIEIPVDLEDAAALRTKMAVELDLLKAMAANANPTVDIHTEINDASLAKTEAELAGAQVAATGFSSGLGGIATAAIVLGPTLIPLIAVIGGLAAALVAPLAIVGGGVGIFAFLSGAAVKNTQAQLKSIDALKTKLAGLTKGTKSYAETASQLAAAQNKLSPAQRAFAHAIGDVHDSMAQLLKGKNGQALLGPVVQALDLFANGMQTLSPILRAVSKAITPMLDSLSKAALSPGFKLFVQAFAKQLGPDLKAFAAIAANVFQGLFGLFGAFNKQLSGSVLKSLVNLTKRFADWGKTLGQSTGFKTFVAYLKAVGPKVSAALGQIAGAFGDIVKAAAPIGGVVLTEIGNLAGAIRKIPADTLQKLVTALVLVVGLAKTLGPITKLLGAIGLAQPEILLTVGALVVLGAGFVDLYNHSKATRQILSDLGDFFQKQLFPIIKTAAQQVMPAVSSAIHDIGKSIKDNKGFLEIMGKLLLTFAAAGVVTAILAVVGAIRLIGKAVALGITGWHIWTDVILIAVAFVIRAFGLLVNAVLSNFSIIVNASAAAFGWMPGIGGKVKAAKAAFDSFSAGVKTNFRNAANDVDNFRHKLDLAVSPPKPIKITVDDIAAIKKLEALRGTIDRAVGPGGGIGQVGDPGPSAVTPPSVRGGNGNGASGSNGNAGLTIEHQTVQAHDYHDFLRQMGTTQRGRAGGGVDLLGASSR